MGESGDFSAGFIVFLGNNKLTIECHGWGDPLPENFRDLEIVVREIEIQGNSEKEHK